MKKQGFLFVLLTLLLTSCDFITVRNSSTNSTTPIESSTVNTSPKDSSPKDSSSKDSSSKDSSSKDSSSKDSSSDDSSSKDSSSSPPIDPSTKPSEITIFSINDLHGSLEENTTNRELGLARLDYAIKHDADYNSETSIIISTGDTWEGGYIAHEEKTLTDKLLKEVGVEAMVLGNHDFSWGIDTIKDLKKVSPYPYIAANIKKGSSHTNDLSDDNIIINKGGAKIGIIGLASAQSSITASDLTDSSNNKYTFDESMNVITSQVNYLNNQNCDLVIVAVHNSLEKDSSNAYTNTGYVYNIGSNFTTSQIQGIFGAHTHSFEKMTVGSNAIPFVQGGCNSKGYSKMTFNLSDKSVKNYNYVSPYNSYNSIKDSDLNQNIINSISTANSKYNAKQQYCKFDYKFSRYNELYSFVPYCMLSEAKRLGWSSSNEFLAIHNTAGIRSDLAAGVATKDSLFKVEPFDNLVKVIENVPGSKIAKVIGTVKDSHLAQYDAYLRETKEEFDSTKTYTVVTIDYVSSSKYWNNNIPSSSYPIYNLDRSSGESKSNAKEKFILNTMLDFIDSEKPTSGLKTYKKADFTV